MTHITISGSLQSNETSALAMAAIEGLGITMLPEAMLKEAILQKKLLPILQPFLAPARDMHPLYTAEPTRLPKLTSFIKLALDYFSPYEVNNLLAK